MTKKYYWLKLKEDFFRDKRIKKLRNIAGGDTYTIIYLKMQLLSLKNEGRLYFEEVEDTFEEEIALEIDENVEDVKVCIMFLIKNGLIEVYENEYIMTETIKNIDSECSSAERVRQFRKRQESNKMLHCNTDVTKCNIDIDIEKDIDIDIEKEKKEKKKNFVKPTIEEIQEYIDERNNGINANAFYDFYESKNWYVGKNKMKDWKACIRTWEQRQTKPRQKTWAEQMEEVERMIEEEENAKKGS